MFKSFRPLVRCLSTQAQAAKPIRKPISQKEPGALSFEQEYNIRSSLEKLITDYSKKSIPKLTLDSLIQISQRDISTNAIATINYLTIFNTKRLQAFRSLPYLVVLNPHISETYELYLKSLKILLELDPYHNDLDKIHNSLLEYSEIHKNAIPSLSRGFTEVSSFFPKGSIVQFLNQHFYDKINMETITNNYINLINKPQDHLGVLNKKIKISDLIKLYAGLVNDMAFIKYYKTVNIKFDYGEDVEFPYIGIHLEYIFTEILKNSIRANIESGNGDKSIKITIVKTDIGNNRHSLGIRIRDDGGGISPEVEANVFDYSFTTVENHEQDAGMGNNVMPGEEVQSMAGMGYGLPLTKAYVELFGGNLELQSIYGLGTDVYIELIGPDTSLL